MATPHLSVQGLQVGYGKRPVLQELSLTALAPGRVVGLLGPNAAGKSTLLKALAGQHRYQGSARFGETELAGLQHRERCRLIGYAPQSLPQPSDLLAYEFALGALKTAVPQLPTAEAEQRIEAAFAQLGLTELAIRPVSELSGGKRQLLGLSQILARRTDVILLDEPTSALDLHWQVETLDVMRTEATSRGALVIMALHDLNLALRFCDDLILLHHGRLLAEGPAATTLTPDLLCAAYGVQARLECCSHGLPHVVVDGAAGRRVTQEPFCKHI